MTVGIPPSVSFESGTSAAGAKRSAATAGTAIGSTAPASDARRSWRERPRWQRRLAALAVVTAGAAIVAGPWWGPRALAQLDFFHVRTVEFDGVRFASTDELLTRLRVDTAQSVWQPLDSLVARVAEHPMVLRVDVERDLPGTLRVHVIERMPVALVPSRGRLRPADATGAVLPIDPAIVPLDMPVAASADSTLLSVLDGLRQHAPSLYARITHASRVRGTELRFALGGGTVGAAGQAMVNTLIVRTTSDVTVERFKDILPVEADLARNHLRAVELDLRFRDQVIARQP